MSLEFEIPLVSLIFILILNIVYFSKKRADLEENKPYKVILISSLIVATIDTVIHIICSANTFESIVNNYYTLLNYLNKILSALFSVIFSSLFCFSKSNIYFFITTTISIPINYHLFSHINNLNHSKYCILSNNVIHKYRTSRCQSCY